MHSLQVYEIKFDDSFIVTASADSSAACWDVTNGTRLTSYVGHTRPVACVDFNASINILVTASFDCAVKIWSFTEGNLLSTLEFELPNTCYESNVTKVKIWGDRLLQPLSSYHILVASDEYQVGLIDYEIQWNTAAVLKKKCICLGLASEFVYSGFHVAGSSLKIWGIDAVESKDFTALTELSFDSVGVYGYRSFVRRPINRVIRIPMLYDDVSFLGSGASFDAFLGCRESRDEDHWQLLVIRNNSETDYFVVDLSDR